MVLEVRGQLLALNSCPKSSRDKDRKHPVCIYICAVWLIPAAGQIHTVKPDQQQSYNSNTPQTLPCVLRKRADYTSEGVKEEGGQGLTGRPGHSSTTNGQGFMLSWWMTFVQEGNDAKLNHKTMASAKASIPHLSIKVWRKHPCVVCLCVLNVAVKGLCVCSGWLLISSSKMTWRSEAVSLYCGSQVVTRSCLGLLCLVGSSFLSSLVIALESIQAQTLWNQFNVRPVLGEK